MSKLRRDTFIHCVDNIFYDTNMFAKREDNKNLFHFFNSSKFLKLPLTYLWELKTLHDKIPQVAFWRYL